MSFDPNIKGKSVIETKAEEKVEYKKLGSTKVRKGLKLFALNNEDGTIYEVKIEDRKEADLTPAFTEEGGVTRIGKKIAQVRPEDKMLWALNEKNALRKFANDPDNLKILAKNGNE